MPNNKPCALRPGGTIGLVAPAGALRESHYTAEYMAALTSRFGFRAVLGDSVHAVHGYLAGDDAARAADIHRMFADPAIDAIWCVRGGYGTPRLLDLLDWDLLKKNPKPLFGYSDITGLHIAMHQLCGYPTLHSPQLCSDPLWEEIGAPGREHLYAALTSTEPLGTLRQPEGCEPVRCVVPGVAEGQVIGGNLSLVAALLGTPYALDARGKILFLEDVGEKTYALDRMLTQLRLAGLFDQCAGIALGTFNSCPVEYPDFGLTLEQVIADVIVPCGKPTLLGLQVGHVRPSLSLPLGVRARLDATAATLTYLEAPWQR